jgi:hypothetical protein
MRTVRSAPGDVFARLPAHSAGERAKASYGRVHGTTPARAVGKPTTSVSHREKLRPPGPGRSFSRERGGSWLADRRR